MSQEFDALLLALADESRPVRSINLFPLSDVDRDRLPRFAGAWSALTPTRRQELIGALVEQAETNIHLNFHAILRSLLGDPDDAVRRLAVEGLWEDERPSLVAPLINLLRDDASVEVRASAASSLGRFLWLGAIEEIGLEPASAAEAALHATWFREREVNAVRRRALESLAFGALPDLNELILNAYYDEDELMRQSALFAMGRTADTHWASLVLSEIDSQEPAMRFEAAQACGEMGLRRAVKPLIRHLDDPDESVREAAVAALGKIGGPVAKRALQAVLKADDEALGQAADDALAELTFAAENDERTPAVRGNGEGMDGADSDFDEDDDELAELGDESDWIDEDADFDEDDLDWDDSDDDDLNWDEDDDRDDVDSEDADSDDADSDDEDDEF